jgi:hypothetical protein
MPRVSCIEEIRTTFASHRYVKIEGLLEEGLRKMLYDWAQRRVDVALPAGTPGQAGAVELYSDQLMEYVLAGIRPRIEELSGLALEPTYSFLRIYRRGNVLRHHKDRSSCEVSVSVNLGPALDPPWPLCIKGPLGESAVAMSPGDAVLYRGIECEHWRDALEADEMAQVFLHFVERGGRYRDWKSDKRPSLGT